MVVLRGGAVSYERGTPALEFGKAGGGGGGHHRGGAAEGIEALALGRQLSELAGIVGVQERGEEQTLCGRRGASGVGRCTATWKREFRLPWRKAGPPNHHDDKVDSDQQVVNKELSLCCRGAGARRGADPVW